MPLLSRVASPETALGGSEPQSKRSRNPPSEGEQLHLGAKHLKGEKSKCLGIIGASDISASWGGRLPRLQAGGRATGYFMANLSEVF